MLEDGSVVGLYCSDVTGAFDRVRKERLVLKLRASGLNARITQFLESWLDDRSSSVIVAGSFSTIQILKNSVFQGTVLGPPLWNIFYADAVLSIRSHDFTEVVFADDFNCWKRFERNKTNEDIFSAYRDC